MLYTRRRENKKRERKREERKKKGERREKEQDRENKEGEKEVITNYIHIHTHFFFTSNTALLGTESFFFSVAALLIQQIYV